VIGSGDRQPADVEGLAQAGVVGVRAGVRAGVGVGVGEPVDAPEVQRLVADVELLQAGQARAHNDVAGLEGAPLAEVQHALEHLAGLPPHRLETIVGSVEELLLSLQIGMVRHDSPSSPARQGNGSA
jgi:hypothetical protein